jgi:hypothetical protein
LWRVEYHLPFRRSLLRETSPDFAMMAGPHQRARLCAGVFLTLLAFGLVAPAPAGAGCGHYVVARSDATRQAAWLVGFAQDASIAARGFPSAPVSPCRGAFCSRNPSQTPIPAAAVNSVGGERWCWTAMAPPTSDGGSSIHSFDETRRVPVHRSRPLEHPPRPSRFSHLA